MTKNVTFTTQFTRSPESIKNSNLVEFKKPSMVKKSLSYAVDINTIYENYCKTGKVPLNGNQPIYDENFVNYDSLVDAQKVVSEAVSYFQSLPTDIKNHYGNSLEKFVKAVSKGDNYLVEKGVFVPKAVEPVVPTPSTPLKPELKPDLVVQTPSTPSQAVTEPVNTATTDIL